MRGLPLRLAILNIGDLVGRDPRPYILPIGRILRLIRTIGRGGEIEPEVSLHIVARYALPKCVKNSQRALRAGVSSISGLAIPRRRGFYIPRKGLARAVPVERGQMNLANDETLIRCLPIPCLLYTSRCV